MKQASVVRHHHRVNSWRLYSRTMWVEINLSIYLINVTLSSQHVHTRILSFASSDKFLFSETLSSQRIIFNILSIFIDFCTVALRGRLFALLHSYTIGIRVTLLWCWIIGGFELQQFQIILLIIVSLFTWHVIIEHWPLKIKIRNSFTSTVIRWGSEAVHVGFAIRTFYDYDY